jgi:hypothetical protein
VGGANLLCMKPLFKCESCIDYTVFYARGPYSSEGHVLIKLFPMHAPFQVRVMYRLDCFLCMKPLFKCGSCMD